jgi:hypothetical protein
MRKAMLAVAAELKTLSDRHRGILKPQVVVDAARDPSSPLHDRFTWDDSVAAEKYRLEEARNLIRLVIEVIPNTDNKPHNVYVSLSQDAAKGGGYRTMVSVLSAAESRAILLEDARREMESFEQKYRTLQEFAVMKKLRGKKRTSAWLGVARQARRGMAWLGWVRIGRQGMARRGLAR